MDCYLPADFFLVDDARRTDEGDVVLGADAHVHFEAPAFVSGLRDLREPAKPRGPYPQRKPRRPRVVSDGEWVPV